jgi:hypothetical protein
MRRQIPARHIQTKPPIPYAIIDQLISNIEQSKELLIDGRVLGAALRFAYFLGFRKREILNLRIEHVLDANQAVRNAIIFDSEQISVPADFTRTIVDYCSYLRTYRKKLVPDWPFFPNRKKDKPYGETTIVRHINHFSGVFSYDITIEKIRQSGICRFYDGLGATQPDYYVQFDALESTARFARVRSIIHAHHILIDQIDEWGNRPKPRVEPPKLIPVDDLIKRVRDAGSLSETAAMEIIEKDLLKVQKSLRKMEELRNEFITGMSAANLDSSVRERLIEKFDAQLQSIGFGVNPSDGRLSMLDDFVSEY